MSRQRPGNRHTNAAHRLLNIDHSDTPIPVDIEAAKARALIGLAEAVGELALVLDRHLGALHHPTTTAAPSAETGA